MLIFFFPAQKSDGQNTLIQNNEQEQYGNHGDFEKFNEHEEYNSIANSFDNIVNILRQYANYSDNNDNFTAMKNELKVPDTLNAGNESDTFLTSVQVEGMKNFRTQKIAMSWGEDLVSLVRAPAEFTVSSYAAVVIPFDIVFQVNAEYSWASLYVKGIFHFVNYVSRYSAPFQITLTEPMYSGDTSMTRNANVYPMMSPASSVTFKKAVIDHVYLPEVFQNQQPKFRWVLCEVRLPLRLYTCIYQQKHYFFFHFSVTLLKPSSAKTLPPPWLATCITTWPRVSDRLSDPT